jgi:hypothetical protein
MRLSVTKAESRDIKYKHPCPMRDSNPQSSVRAIKSLAPDRARDLWIGSVNIVTAPICHNRRHGISWVTEREVFCRCLAVPCLPEREVFCRCVPPCRVSQEFPAARYRCQSRGQPTDSHQPGSALVRSSSYVSAGFIKRVYRMRHFEVAPARAGFVFSCGFRAVSVFLKSASV